MILLQIVCHSVWSQLSFVVVLGLLCMIWPLAFCSFFRCVSRLSLPLRWIFPTEQSKRCTSPDCKLYRCWCTVLCNCHAFTTIARSGCCESYTCPDWQMHTSQDQSAVSHAAVLIDTCTHYTVNLLYHSQKYERDERAEFVQYDCRSHLMCTWHHPLLCNAPHSYVYVLATQAVWWKPWWTMCLLFCAQLFDFSKVNYISCTKQEYHK